MTSRSSRQNQSKRRRPKNNGRHRQLPKIYPGHLIVGICLLILAGIIFFQTMLLQPKPSFLIFSICGAYFSTGALYIALNPHALTLANRLSLGLQALAFLLTYIGVKPTFSFKLWAWLGLSVSLIFYLLEIRETLPNGPNRTGQSWATLAILLLTLGALIGPKIMASQTRSAETAAPKTEQAATKSQNSASQQPNSTSKPTKSEPKKYFKDNTLKRSDLYLQITQKAVIPPGQAGNMQSDHPVLAIWYSAKNTGRDIFSPQDAWIGSINAYQATADDPNHKLDLSALPDDKYATTQTTDLQPGQAGQGVIGYELVDQTTPVTLRADVIDEDLGTMTVQLQAN